MRVVCQVNSSFQNDHLYRPVVHSYLTLLSVFFDYADYVFTQLLNVLINTNVILVTTLQRQQIAFVI